MSVELIIELTQLGQKALYRGFFAIYITEWLIFEKMHYY